MWDRPNTKEYYIGLQITASTPTASDYWLDGSNSTYRAYAPGEPNDYTSCVIIEVLHGNLIMEDHQCDADKRSVCKKPNGKITHTRARTHSHTHEFTRCVYVFRIEWTQITCL